MSDHPPHNKGRVYKQMKDIITEEELEIDEKLRKYTGDAEEEQICQKASAINEIIAKCNWCGNEKVLLANKKFCESCIQQGRMSK